MGSQVKHHLVAALTRNNKIDIFCLVETKLADPNHKTLIYVGLSNTFSFCYKNARGASMAF